MRTVHAKAVFWASACLALVACPVSGRGQQDQAVKAIESAGGHVMQIVQGEDSLEVTFHLSDKEIGDNQIKPIAQLPQIIWLNLARTKISDAGLESVEKLTGLEKLHLEKTAITDAGLKHLEPLQKLTYLNLYGTKVTDAGMENLKGLSSLKRLFVWQTGVTDAGIHSLKAALPEVEIISGATLAEPPAADEKPAEKTAENPEEQAEKKADKKAEEKAQDKPTDAAPAEKEKAGDKKIDKL